MNEESEHNLANPDFQQANIDFSKDMLNQIKEDESKNSLS